MDTSTSVDTHHEPHAHDAAHEHHELGWWRKYIFSTDHKVIGIQYGLCGLSFLFFGFCLMMLMRWQLAYPGQALPVIGKWLPHIFGPGMADGKMTPDFYNSLGAMHGTIMIFAGVVPLAFAAFGNFVVPLQIGAPDMTFPKVNAASFWAFGVGGVIMMISFFVPGGPAKSGWTSYTPLADISDTGPGHNARIQWADALVDRIYFSDLLVAAWRRQFHHDHHSTARQGTDLDAAAVFRLGPVCYRISVAAGISAARSGNRHAVNGSGRAHQLLPAGRPGREWRAGKYQRRRQPTFVATSVLVPRASRRFTC